MKTKDWFSRFDPLHLRRQSTALLLAVVYLSTLAAHAQNATWLIPNTSDWNTASNWSPPTVPTGEAIFGASASIKTLTFSQDTTVGALQIANPGYTFEVSAVRLTINGLGLVASSLITAPTFNVSSLSNPALIFTSGTAGSARYNLTDTADMEFHGTSTAENARITLGLPISANGGFDAGFLKFFNSSTAGKAMINTLDGSNTEFHDGSMAGTATIIAGSGGFIFFNDTSTADHATITVNPGGDLDFANAFFNGGISSAGNATISNSGIANFFQGSTAENATITTKNGGVTSFFGRSTGGNAAFITDTGASSTYQA